MIYRDRKKEKNNEIKNKMESNENFIVIRPPIVNLQTFRVNL